MVTKLRAGSYPDVLLRWNLRRAAGISAASGESAIPLILSLALFKRPTIHCGNAQTRGSARRSA